MPYTETQRLDFVLTRKAFFTYRSDESSPHNMTYDCAGKLAYAFGKTQRDAIDFALESERTPMPYIEELSHVQR